MLASSAYPHLIAAFIPLVLKIAQLISQWLWSGDLSRAEPGGGGAAAAAAVLAGAPEGARPPEGHQEEEARLRPQVSNISYSQALDLLLMYFSFLFPFAQLFASIVSLGSPKYPSSGTGDTLQVTVSVFLVLFQEEEADHNK